MTSAPPSTIGSRISGATLVGFAPQHPLHWNLGPAALYEHALRRGEGVLAESGPFCAVTSPHTGRSPNDKFVTEEPSSADQVWWGKVNQPLSSAHFDRLANDVMRHLNSQELFVRDLFAGADSAYRLPVRFLTPSAWHTLFVSNMFLRPTTADLGAFKPAWHVLHAPEMQADPDEHGTRSGTFIVLNFARRVVLIGGTRYAGEMKKSIFTVLNYLLPAQGVLPMHCSANVGDGGDVALFFGLSGTGKTTLSADPHRNLIGDDEHGWSDAGVFNFEGGCYAKVINLSPEGEPDIFLTTQMFGTILENVVLDANSRRVNFADGSITENTRASYPLHYIRNCVPGGRGGHPRNVIFLTADAFGVLPPIARLTPEQAMYYFLSGYTAKVAGTERGVTEPQATFSACFGAVFLVWHPTKYADMLGKLLSKHKVAVWLVNTGWTGGPFGVGRRMKLAYTRAMVRAALGGELAGVPTTRDPIFGLSVPAAVKGVPSALLSARATWSDPAAYDAQARKLAAMFEKNFEQFADASSAAVRRAGPITR